MLETIETHAEQTDKAMLLDGSLVPINDAKITIASLCNALDRFDGFAQLNRLFAMRLWADDLQGYIEHETHGDPDTDYARYKMTSVNDILQSPVFELPQNDNKWIVPPRTAVAVLRNTVAITTEGGGEIWLQEPCAGRALLAEVWREAPR